ncbi:MAG TPA: hypothetical protein VGX68_27970 [Thermoanaerobaculia bacterium]|jgi:hypothetical protein|nr:hypothetical protein [Thermoanaerobaculia bacterium]
MNFKPKSLVLFILLAVLFALPSQAQTCIKFEAPAFPIPTVYGTPAAQVSGDLAFTFNLIDAYIWNFNTFGPGIAFNRAYIDVAPVAFSPGQSLRFNNISMLFDLRNLAFAAHRVTFAYLDLGGYENLEVNGSLHLGELTAAPAMLGGTSVSVSSTPLPPPRSGKFGTVTIVGNVIKTVRVGGQELWIDSFCVSQ